MKCFRKNKILKLLFLTILPCFSCFCFWDDIMEEVFKPVQDNIIYIWDSVSSVWKTILQEKTEADGWLSYDTQDPLIVRVVKFILKMTVVLSVTMVIFYSVKFLIEVFKWSDLKSVNAKKDLINLIIWLLIALFSITIIELVISIPKSSLKTSGDIAILCDLNKGV